MARFYPLYVRRSDGKLEAISYHRKKEPNQPTADQLNKKPNSQGISDYYREVPMDETKHLDWRRKLGGMLARSLGFTDPAKAYMLVSFPENYRLWEHVKKAEGESKVKLNKTHAGGGNERQDAYLYGHPQGRRKRYRSPADFFPHLYWLVTDESGDSDNCACKICTPEEFDDKLLPARVMVKGEPFVKEEGKPLQHPVIDIPRQASAQGTKARNSPAGTSAATSTITALAQTSSSLPRPVKGDQALDVDYDKFVFRQGELVWFNRGNAWGLGLITKRWRQGQEPARRYILQPLSHPYGHPQAVTVTGDENLRPWLAWSVPSFTCAGLNNMQISYETADWTGIFQRKYGSGDFEVDGSILAAKAVDGTYTTFDLASRMEPEAGLIELHWTGIYLGAERVWVGDPVRLRLGSGNDLLIVHDIVERVRTSTFNQQVLDKSIHLIGDVYTLKQAAHTSTADPFPPGLDMSNLPGRLVEDMRQRNIRSISTRQVTSYWQLVRATSRVELRDFKGRWYEATLLLPILDASAWADDLRRGDIVPETGLRMNGRHDCQSTPTLPASAVPDVRKLNRVEAYGKAMPAGVAISENSLAPPALRQLNEQAMGVGVDSALGASAGEDAQQTFSTPEAANGGVGDAGGGLEDFMDLTGMDGGGDVSGFSQEFGGQAGGQQQHFY